MTLLRTPTEEELYAKMQQGMATAAVMDVMVPLVERRQTILVHDAIRRYRSREHKYTPDEAILFVANLTANQDMLDDLQSIIRDGQKAGQHFVK